MWLSARFGSLVAVIVAWGCATDDGRAPGDLPGDSSATGGPNITTIASTIDPGDPTAPPDDDSTTQRADETTAAIDTRGETSTSDDSSGDDEVGTSGPGESSSDDAAAESSSSSDSDPSTTAATMSTTMMSDDGPCMPNAPGNYADCLGDDGSINTAVCANPTATCLVNDVNAAVIGGCAVQGCTDACDCPPHPGSGSAAVACEDLTGDAFAECFLDCTGGATCPAGMQCFAGTVCLWPTAGAQGTPYGDCATGGAAACGFTSTCLFDGPPQTIGVCAEPCSNAADCSASPGGTAPVTCADLTQDGVSECHLACGGGLSCPAGMTCFGNLLCAWNV